MSEYVTISSEHLIPGGGPWSPSIIFLAISSHILSTQCILTTNFSDYSVIHLSIQSAMHKEFMTLSDCTVTPQQHFRSMIVTSTSKIDFHSICT